MPNRILRDWTDSDRVDLLSCNAERFFTRLIMKVDDYGCFYADPRRLRVALFPLKEGVTAAEMDKSLSECVVARLVNRYESDGKPYLQIANFHQRLRIMRRKFPEPTETNPERNPERNPESEEKRRHLPDTWPTNDGHLTDTTNSGQFAESPSWQEFWDYCQSQACLLPAEWYARDKFEAAEADNWKGRSNWQAYARRCKGWWEQDGRPIQPKKSGKPAPESNQIQEIINVPIFR